ncbi:hypothetical protein HID58_046087, partial [Brassica napus]
IADEDVPRILSLRISKTGRKDGYSWNHTNSGCYTVKSTSGRWRCQFDASWTEQDTGAGLGFILFDGDIVAMRGQRKHINPSTPLHAEAESLIWAMEELRGRGFQ